MVKYLLITYYHEYVSKTRYWIDLKCNTFELEGKINQLYLLLTGLLQIMVPF